MDMKMIATYTVIIILTSTVLGAFIKAIPKIIEGLLKFLVIMMFVVTFYRNASFVKEITPQLKDMAEELNVTGIFNSIIFYFTHYFKILIEYVMTLS